MQNEEPALSRAKGRNDRSFETQGAELDVQAGGGKVTPDPGSDYLITVQIEEQYEGALGADALHRLAMKVLRAEKVEGPVEVGVVVTNDAEVRALNTQYLGHDYETDVLAFGMIEDDEFVTPAERPSYLGDVVISYDRAAEQAPDYGHSTEAEVATLLVHGLLHLLGYNDTEEDERQRMQARQNEILSSPKGQPDFGF